MDRCNVTSGEIYDAVRNSAAHFIQGEYDDDTNLLGITSFRNIIYMLIEIEKRIGLKITDSFIDDIRELTINKLMEVIPRHNPPK